NRQYSGSALHDAGECRRENGNSSSGKGNNSHNSGNKSEEKGKKSPDSGNKTQEAGSSIQDLGNCTQNLGNFRYAGGSCTPVQPVSPGRAGSGIGIQEACPSGLPSRPCDRQGFSPGGLDIVPEGD